VTGVLHRHLERRFLTSTQKSDLVSYRHGWRGFLFLRLDLLNLCCRLPRVRTASVTTGRLILKGWRWHFFITQRLVPVSLHEGWRGFLFGNLLVKISQVESSWWPTKNHVIKPASGLFIYHVLARNSDRLSAQSALRAGCWLSPHESDPVSLMRLAVFLFLQSTLLNFNQKCGRAAPLLRKVLTEKHLATNATNRRGALFFKR